MENLSLYTRQSSILKNFSKQKNHSIPNESRNYSKFSDNLIDLQKIKRNLIREKKKNLIRDNVMNNSNSSKKIYEEILEIIISYEEDNEIKRQLTIKRSKEKFISDNYLIRTKTAPNNEHKLLKKQTMNKKPGCLFLPSDKFTNFWQSMITIVLFYVTFMLTFELTFITNPNLFFRISEYITSVLFTLDIFFNFNLSYYKSTQKLVYSRKKIAIKYLKFWFWMDIISAFPFYIFDFFKDYNYIQNIKTTKIFKYVKIVRLSRLVKYFSKIFPKESKKRYQLVSLYMKNNISRLVKHLFIVLIISHFFSCIFYLLPLKINPDVNWVVQKNIQNKSPFEQYLFSLHWMIETVITVGYGEIQFK
jgi:hypothetical protein